MMRKKDEVKLIDATEKNLKMVDYSFNFTNYASLFFSFLSLLMIGLAGFLGYLIYNGIEDAFADTDIFSISFLLNNVSVIVWSLVFVVGIIILIVLSIVNFKASLKLKHLSDYEPAKKYIYSNYVINYAVVFLFMIFIFASICLASYLLDAPRWLIASTLFLSLYLLFPVVLLFVDYIKMKKAYKSIKRTGEVKIIVYDEY